MANLDYSGFKRVRSFGKSIGFWAVSISAHAIPNS